MPRPAPNQLHQTGIEFREAEENVWETKRVAVADGFEIGPPWESKVGYRFAGDDC